MLSNACSYPEDPLASSLYCSPLRVATHIVKKRKFIFLYNDLDIQIHIFLCYYLPKLSSNIYSLKYYEFTTTSFSILVKTRK